MHARISYGWIAWLIVAGVGHTGCGDDEPHPQGMMDGGEGRVTCTAEYCDGRDNDCDGKVDEGLRSSLTECGVGACAATGERRCVGGAWTDSCSPGIPAPSDTICNGLDGDCDGLVDEDYPGTETTCGMGACAGNAGMRSCVDGVEVDSCDPFSGAGSDDSCDGVDQDCDGITDDDYIVTSTTCGVGACAGNTGELLCIGGDQTNTCDPLEGATTETCNGEDDDCDSMVDDGSNDCGGICALPATAGTTCDGPDSDLCNEGTWICSGLNAIACGDSTGDTLELYGDGIDNDCDGELDEDLRRYSGTVLLAGTLSFDVCELNGASRVRVDSELTLTCRTLFIDEGAAIVANAVGDEGLCTGGNGGGGGGSASGGGGGGGCYAAPAGNGGYGQWIAVATPGAGGTATYGTVSSAEVYSGSKGGDGGGIPCFPYAPGTCSWGALGGGVISISVAEEATIAGTISANGGNGNPLGWNICDDGAGGGGAGGTVVLETAMLTLESTARLSADGGVGGKGGSGCGPASHGGGGGGGSGGRVKIATDLATLDGTSYDAVASFLESASSVGVITASGGAGGLAGGSTALPGESGDAGTIAELAP